jgi:hypothetical protein
MLQSYRQFATHEIKPVGSKEVEEFLDQMSDARRTMFCGVSYEIKNK